MPLKRQRDQVHAHLLWRRYKHVSSRIIFFSWSDKYPMQGATKSILPKCRDNSSIDAEDFENEEIDIPSAREISDEELPVESDSS